MMASGSCVDLLSRGRHDLAKGASRIAASTMRAFSSRRPRGTGPYLEAYVWQRSNYDISTTISGKAPRGGRIEGIWATYVDGVAVNGGDFVFPDYGAAKGGQDACQRGTWWAEAISEQWAPATSAPLEVDDCGEQEERNFRFKRWTTRPILSPIRIPRPKPPRVGFPPSPPRVLIPPMPPRVFFPPVISLAI